VFRTREKRRLLQWFFLSSLLPFAIELLLVMPLVLGFDAPAMGPFYTSSKRSCRYRPRAHDRATLQAGAAEQRQ
jgi:hypothetical protein